VQLNLRRDDIRQYAATMHDRRAGLVAGCFNRQERHGRRGCEGGGWLFRGHFPAFGDSLVEGRGALGEKGDALEQVHGAIQLWIV